MLPSPPFDAAFWTQWSDGTAEVAAYDLTTPRYNATRSGTAVTIFVTEPFSESARVKADPGVHPPADEFPVMKLNLVKDYQTGIYDYNEMLSAFIGLKPSGGRPAGAAAKISFSAQEWCGHVYAQLLPAAGSLTVSSHSYWDNQADQLRSIPGDPAAFPEDTLLLWARGYATPHVAPGGRQAVRLLSSFFTARAAPEKLRYSPAVLLRAAQPETLAMPGGARQALRSTVEVDGQPAATVFTEPAPPYRILQWRTAAGESATLLQSARLKYWELNSPGGEKALESLGLRLRPPRTM
jgi:hypothetical protein